MDGRVRVLELVLRHSGWGLPALRQHPEVAADVGGGQVGHLIGVVVGDADDVVGPRGADRAAQPATAAVARRPRRRAGASGDRRCGGPPWRAQRLARRARRARGRSSGQCYPAARVRSELAPVGPGELEVDDAGLAVTDWREAPAIRDAAAPSADRAAVLVGEHDAGEAGARAVGTQVVSCRSRVAEVIAIHGTRPKSRRVVTRGVTQATVERVVAIRWPGAPGASLVGSAPRLVVPGEPGRRTRLVLAGVGDRGCPAPGACLEDQLPPAGHDSRSTRRCCSPSTGCRSRSRRRADGRWSCTASACRRVDHPGR